MKTSKIISTYLHRVTAVEKAPKELIDDLNRDLELEFAAMVQYLQHSQMLMGASEETFAKELLTHADEEWGHAKKIAERISYLGGTVGMKIGETEAAPTTVGMLKIDLKGEEIAIDRYRSRISWCDSHNDPGTAQIIREIIVDEESHRDELLIYLNLKS
jgi:bacterioferritin